MSAVKPQIHMSGVRAQNHSGVSAQTHMSGVRAQTHMSAVRAQSYISAVRAQIRAITKLPNTKESSKGKGKTHKSTNRQNQSTTGKLGKLQ